MAVVGGTLAAAVLALYATKDYILGSAPAAPAKGKKVRCCAIVRAAAYMFIFN